MNKLYSNGGYTVQQSTFIEAFKGVKEIDGAYIGTIAAAYIPVAFVVFAEHVADIFASNGFIVYLFDALRPTPELSFAIRELGCQSGVMVTASHNPKEYNGYKAYWNDGSQVTSPHDVNIIEEVGKVAMEQVLTGKNPENIHILGEEFDKLYLAAIKALSLSPECVANNADMKIVYTPLHGAGVNLVPASLANFGFKNVITVKEQCVLDGDFPTVASPNPEERKTMQMAIDLAQAEAADLVLATDPDSDRLGVALRTGKGDYVLLNGNQTASLLTYYILRRWSELGKLDGKQYIVKTIVTTELLRAIAEKYGERFVDNVAFYTKDNVFYLPEESRWSYIIGQAKQDDIALKIDTALFTIEKANPALKGALPDNYYSRLHIDTAKLASLLDEIDRINTDDAENDIIGRVYEYFLSKFALAEGKGKGEFYTPKCIVNLIAELLEPYDGTLYDPCCGSGGMFVQSIKFVEAHSGNKKKISIYGQEYTNTTFKLAKMNLAIRGIAANLGEMAANTFTNDQHKDLKADFIMANPPFNQKSWRAENELTDDDRWNGYDVPPTSNANYGWILHMVSHLSQNGVAGFLLANGALSGDGTELAIRKKLIDLNLLDAVIGLPANLFYGTSIPACILVFKKGRTSRDVLFIDASKEFEQGKNQNKLRPEDINKIVVTYKERTVIEKYSHIATLDEIKENDYNLSVSSYVETKETRKETNIKKLNEHIRKIVARENELRNEIDKIIAELEEDEL